MFKIIISQIKRKSHVELTTHNIDGYNYTNILERQYNKITAVEDTTVLAKYLDPSNPVATRSENYDLIYPFGLNQSQKKAVENAFSSQISIIQGPPGTGKTQTILNIIANAVRKGKTVAVVSNNNSATQNVAEKLEKQGVSFITAFLGSLYNKEQFLLSQTGMYPSMSGWILQKESHDKLSTEVQQLSEELNSMLDSRNRIAQIEQELLTLKPEQFYFEEYYKTKGKVAINSSAFSKFPSGKLLSLWLEYEHNADKKPGFFKRLLIALRFSRTALAIFKYVPEEAIPFLQDLFYKTKLQELQEERRSLEEKLRNVLTSQDIKIADTLWNKHKFDEWYHFATHSMLASAAEIWHNVPSVLLREHYRCHPKIAAFFNQKFYNGELIVMTADQGEQNVLTMYRTVPGNHARGHLNQRQIDVIREEVLPALQKQGYKDIGVITPYRDQVAATKTQLGSQYDVATVHKFQGREKDAIASVGDELSAATRRKRNDP